MSTTIAEHVLSCLESFKSITSIFISASESQCDSEKPKWKIENEMSRFKVWSGNIGAHQRGKSSLDYRLRDASHLSTQVKTLLQDLKHALNNAFSILDGTKIPWDQELAGNESDDESISGPEDDDIEFATEMDQLLADIAEIVSCLLNLSVSIRNPAPHDRFRGSTKTDTSFYEPADIAHVQAKFGQANPSLVKLLGKANTRRRQFFKYRETHHQKLSRGLENDFDTGKTVSERQSTVASSIPDRFKTSSLGLTKAVDVDELSDSGFTQTSFASSANTSDRPRFPALPSEATKKPFQCPFCFMMIHVTSSYAWRKHIFTDLRPYICVAVDCPIAGTEFNRRGRWMHHMLQNHWQEWRCQLCDHEPFTSKWILRDHLEHRHAEVIPADEIETAMYSCEYPQTSGNGSKCPLCHLSLESVKAYRHHVGRHLEDIALFVLPQLPGGFEDSDDGSSTSSELQLSEPGDLIYPFGNEEGTSDNGSTDGGRHITSLTDEQTRFLKSEFAKQPYPNAAHRERLSREIPGLNPRLVQTWFQNRRAKAKRLVAEESRKRGGMPHQTTTLDLAPGSCTSSEDDSTSGREMIGIVENSSEVAGEATTGSRQFENLEGLREAISAIPQHVEGPPRRNSATSPDDLFALRQQRESSTGAAEANSSSDSGPSTLTNIDKDLDDPETAQHAPTLLTKWDRSSRGSTAVESSTLMEEFNGFWAKIKAQPDSYLMTQDEFNKYGTLLWQFGDTKTVVAALDRYDQQTPSRSMDNLNPKHLFIEATSPYSAQDLSMLDGTDVWESQNTMGDSISPRPDSRAAARFVGDDDADGEDEDEEMSDQEHFPLLSPIVHQSSVPEVETVPNNTISLTFNDDSASKKDKEPAPAPAPVQEQQEQDDDDDMEDDWEAALEAELEAAFEADSESDISEED